MNTNPAHDGITTIILVTTAVALILLIVYKGRQQYILINSIAFGSLRSLSKQTALNMTTLSIFLMSGSAQYLRILSEKKSTDTVTVH